MGKIDYPAIYKKNREGWRELTDETNFSKYEMFVAGHYSEHNHFIYELLQNAEDECATQIVFDYYEDKLIVYHNGKPFNEKNVKGICAFLEGTKDKDDAQTIGRFGLGFKSVFKYCDRPEIYSNEEAFCIVRYLLPEELPLNGFPQNCRYRLGDKDIYPFEHDVNSTRFVLPYKESILDSESNIRPNDIIEKLIGLEPEILLFLKNIKQLIWVDNITGRYGYYKRTPQKNDKRFCICEAYDSKHDKPIELNYLVFERTFKNGIMKKACVKIAFRLNSTKNNINVTEDSAIWVFFPTKDTTNLPFIIHGTYETPVSREKIMHPSSFNAVMRQQTEYLFIDCLARLKKYGLLTQGFIKQILIPAFDSKTLGGLKERVTKVFSEEPLIPTRSGDHRIANETRIAVPYDLYKIVDKDSLSECLSGVLDYVAFGDVRNSIPYYKWLTQDIGISIWSISEFATFAMNTPIERFGKYEDLLRYLAGLPPHDRWERDVGSYNYIHDQSVAKAWPLLKKAALIKAEDGSFVAAEDENGKHNVYFHCEDDVTVLPNNKIVAEEIEKDEELNELLANKFDIVSFDYMEYVKSEILIKYKENINAKRHIEDIKSIIKLIHDESLNPHEISELLKGCYLLRLTKIEEEKIWYGCPASCYFEDTREGICLKDYFHGVSEKSFVDFKFYGNNEIFYEDLKLLGVRDSIAIDWDKAMGDYYDTDNWGRPPKWKSVGDFKYELSFECIDEVLKFISNNPKESTAKPKSAVIFALLQKYEKHLAGKLKIGANNPEDKDKKSKIVVKLNDMEWLYTKSGGIVNQAEISKYDLDESLYGKLLLDSKLYEILGFSKGSRDEAEKTLREYVSFPENKREIIAELWLKERFGITVEDLEHHFVTSQFADSEFDDSSESDGANEFPNMPIKSLEYLKRHVMQAVTFANPVKYEPKFRSIRTSRDEKAIRIYLADMYAVHGNRKLYACQMCQNTFGDFEAAQIEESQELELDQMNICLCPNCAVKFRRLRKNSSVMENFWSAIQVGDINSEVAIEIQAGDKNLRFTQTHLAEIQEILKLK